MNIYAITLVQDEADILQHTLSKAEVFFDHVFVYDTGSVDGSPEIVKRHSHSSHIFCEPVLFHEFDTRHHALSLASGHFRAGDWVVWLDADEEVAITRDKFQQRAEGTNARFIRHRHYNFGFSEKDLHEEWQYFSGLLPFDATKYSLYREYAYSEFKAIKWDDRLEEQMIGGRNPILSYAIPAFRLPILHYQYRSTRQMLKRMFSRNLIMNAHSDVKWARHWRQDDLSKFVLSDSESYVHKFFPSTIEIDLNRKDGRHSSKSNYRQRIAEEIKLFLKSSSFVRSSWRHLKPTHLPQVASPIPKSQYISDQLRAGYHDIDNLDSLNFVLDNLKASGKRN